MDSTNPNWPKSRQSPRRKVEVPLSVTLESGTFRGWTTDVGAGGMGITVAAEMAVGAELSVEFAVEGGAPIKARGVVRYREGFKYGLEFLMIMPNDLGRLKKYVLSGASV
jgi:hypothetical protein